MLGRWSGVSPPPSSSRFESKLQAQRGKHGAEARQARVPSRENRRYKLSRFSFSLIALFELAPILFRHIRYNNVQVWRVKSDAWRR